MFAGVWRVDIIYGFGVGYVDYYCVLSCGLVEMGFW